METEQLMDELTQLSDQIDLTVNYLSCLSYQLSKDENTSVLWSLKVEKGLENMMNNLDVISKNLVKTANQLEVSE